MQNYLNIKKVNVDWFANVEEVKRSYKGPLKNIKLQISKDNCYRELRGPQNFPQKSSLKDIHVTPKETKQFQVQPYSDIRVSVNKLNT